MPTFDTYHTLAWSVYIGVQVMYVHVCSTHNNIWIVNIQLVNVEALAQTLSIAMLQRLVCYW